MSRPRHRHVVGHDVDDEAEALLAAGGDEAVEGLPTAEVVVDAGVVEHVVAVGGPGGGFEDGREIEVTHPERGEVCRVAGCVVEAETGVELQTIGRGRDHPAGPWSVR